MIVTVLALSWAGLVLAAAARIAPAPVRVRVGLLVDRPPRPRRSPVAEVTATIGAWILRAAGLTPSEEVSLRLGRAVLAALATAVVLAPATPLVAAGAWVLPAHRARLRDRRVRDAVVRELPEVADLFALALGAGLTVPMAVRAVGHRAPGALGAERRRVVAEAELGQRLAAALEEVPERLGDDVRPLVAALVASDRYGAPLLDGLDRLGAELRHARRRRAEEAARRVPVKLLFPLVFCILPAFALLTVAPLLAGAVGALRL